jgi:hypothetical protein
MIETIALILTGLSISASIVYYTSVLRNADKTRQTQLLMDIKRKTDDPEFWRMIHEIGTYEWSDYEEYEKKYGRTSNPKAASEIASLMAFYNSIGVLVATDRIELELLGKILGPMPSMFWNKFESIFHEERKRLNNPYAYVYVEYLKDEQLKRVARPSGKVAYLAK